MKRKLCAPDDADTASKRRRPSQYAPMPAPSLARGKRRQPTSSATVPLLPSPPASVSPVDKIPDAARTSRILQPALSPSFLPDDANLLSPRTPVYHRSAPDPDFGARVCKAWEVNRERSARIRPFKECLRKYKYGEEIAARYSPGATPEHIANEYTQRQAELVRQYEEEMSDFSEDGEWEKQELLRRAQQITDASQGHADTNPTSKKAASPIARIRRKRGLERRDSHTNSLEGEPSSDVGCRTSDGDDLGLGCGDDEREEDQAGGHCQGKQTRRFRSLRAVVLNPALLLSRATLTDLDRCSPRQLYSSLSFPNTSFDDCELLYSHCFTIVREGTTLHKTMLFLEKLTTSPKRRSSDLLEAQDEPPNQHRPPSSTL